MKKDEIARRKKIYIHAIIRSAIIVTCCAILISSELLFGTFSSLVHSMQSYAYNNATTQIIEIDSFQRLINYSNSYTNSNRNDTLRITFGNSSTSGELKDYKSIGSAEFPFDGRIEIADGMTFNLPTAMFGGITDDVDIVDIHGNPTTLVLTRTRATENDSLFANYVKHTRSSGSIDWRIHSGVYRNPEIATESSSYYAYNFAGFIGELGENASVKLTLTIENNDGSRISQMVSTGDSGLVCRKMGINSKLEIVSVTLGARGSGDFSVSSTSKGNAGGIVGTMNSGSVLTLDADVENVQSSGQSISATKGYAGGIAGKVDGGTIVFNTSNPYVISQNINGLIDDEGLGGSGAIAGYYSTIILPPPVSDDKMRYSISTDKYSIENNCYVNGDGQCGGLFGEVRNDGDMTISGSSPVSACHQLGAAKTYGALIGKYYSMHLKDSLTVTTSGKHLPNRSGGTIEQYGGLIGEVFENNYVHFENVKVSSSGATGTSNFGGLVGKAEKGFVEISGTNEIGYRGNSSDKRFAGIVSDLSNGVLYLRGTTNLQDTPLVTNATETSGQIVGYRDYGLVFAEAGWNLIRSSNNQTLDDIGSWGEVVRFNLGSLNMNNVLAIDPNHYVTINPADGNMDSVADIVTTALNIQLNKGQNADTDVIRCSGTTGDNLLTSTLSIDNSVADTIDLSGIGFTGFTRDNNVERNTFKGTFNGNGKTLKLTIGEDYCPATSGIGHGKIYRHRYNGLFARTEDATIKNLAISDDSYIHVNSKVITHIGNLVGQASGDLTIDSVVINGDSSARATITGDGSSSKIGGFVGSLSDAGTVDIKDSEFNGKINGSATDSTVGGLIGVVSNSNTFGITIEDTTVSGQLVSGSGNSVGGVIAIIDSTGNVSSNPSSGRNLTIDNLTISGLNMNVSDTCGGFLGQSWYETDVVFTENKGVTVKDSATLTSAGETAGLVHTATGYWKVNEDGIKLQSMSVTADSAESFGLIVNKGYDYSDDEKKVKSAIYLELLPGAYDVSNPGVSLTLGSVATFDELVAFSSRDNVMKNGQGVVSIATDSHNLLKMGTNYTGATYQHQTAFLGSHSDLINNPNTRYYYNLDNYRESPSSNEEKLLIWSVRQYAHSSIKGYFNFSGNSIGSSIDDDDFDMKGYSYYPVDLESSLTLKGTIHLYNTEFDSSERGTTDSRETTEQSQHYVMHNSLFRNVSGTLTAEIRLDGNVKKIDDYCGALVMGTVSSSASAYPGTINLDQLVLDGIEIDNFNSSGYYPLLINKAGSNAVLEIKKVSNTNKYSAMGAGATTPKYIASSLLGQIGTSTATSVKLNFSEIKLDGRNASGVSDAKLSGLSSTYNSTGSLFSRATLVDKLSYANSSGSFGVYNYTYNEDWGGSRSVTYGHEIYNSNENGDKQRHYAKSPGVVNYYTRPDENPSSNNSVYSDFPNKFIKYVYDTSVATSHELRVNISTESFRGCGTYNDPYIITSGTDIENIARIINNTFSSNIDICVPTTVTNSLKSITWCDNKDTTSHTSYSVGNDSISPSNITYDTLREYLAGAYYQIDHDITGKIVINSGFDGISLNVTSTFAFRGVIDGTGHIIVNKSNNPLIVSSNGCVVRNMTIEIKPASTKTLNISNTKPFQPNGNLNGDRCDAYGAVIGQVFGGDNIIDDVSVDFSDTTIKIITKDKDKAYLVPIGGYIGVVVNGGVYFRNMTGLAADNQSGITANNLGNFGSGVGKTPNDPTAQDNTKWLYINPIVGRVINGFVVTESTSYKPFEDGSRTYPDGTKVYWHGTEANSTEAGKIGVTMRNGTKNYSIADIKTDANTFTMPSGTEGTMVTVSNAQSLFIISLITESGLGTSSNSMYDNTNNLLKPYNVNMATHHAEYNHIGESGLLNTNSDYILATKDTCTGGTDTIPYVIFKYTPKIDDSHYPAFNLAAYEGGKNELYLNMTFAKSNGDEETYYMPDGFRGLGALLLQNGDNTDWANSSTDNDAKTRVFNAMFLTSLTGNDRFVSLNMNLYLYLNDNYSTPSRNQGYLKTGYGFFNALRSTGGSAESNQLKDLTIKGSVCYDLFNESNGKSIQYTDGNLNKNNRPAVGGFIGAPGVDTNTDGGGGDMYLKNICLDNLRVQGVRFAGGMVGCSNASRTYSFIGCGADNLEVVGGTSVGGLIGYARHGSSIVYADFENKEFGIISIVSRSTWSKNDLGDNAVGTLIGDDYQNNQTGMTIKNVTIKNASSFETGYVGYDETSNNSTTPKVGGVIGTVGRNGKCTFENVTVKNINMAGGKVGGFIGYITGNSPISITNCRLTSDIELSDESGCFIENKYTGNDNGASGGIIGYSNANNANARTVLINCSVDSYKIKGDRNCGGLIGQKVGSKDPIAKIQNISIDNVIIGVNQQGGGIVGLLKNGNIEGYNIYENELTFVKYTGSSISRYGYVAGDNNSGKTIKLVGFSRQGTISIDKLIGYGSNSGYVIFADYNNAGNTPYVDSDTENVSYPTRNTLLSGIANIGNNGTNIEYTDHYEGNSMVSDCWPYVISSPRFDITGTQFFTGDGVSANSYYGSAAQRILTEIDSNKGYKNTGLSSEEKDKIQSALTANMLSIKGVVTSGASYNGEDFPVLVLDDLATADTMVKNYLKLLTNTDYNYACGYSNGTTYSGNQRNIYNVSITKWKYNGSEFVKQAGEASLKCDVNYRFYITPTEVDNENWQFSLIDVQFYDPSNIPTFKNNSINTAGKIAYHLYVPVVVKKMLHYTVEIRPASTTTYKLDAYPDNCHNLLENLGNPVTIKVTYTYRQTAQVWEDAINGGESVYRNYSKVLSIKSFRNDDIFPGIGAGHTADDQAVFVLVDPNGDADAFSYGKFKKNESDSGVLVDSEYSAPGSKSYDLILDNYSTSCKLNDLMEISLNTDPDVETNLVVWEEGDGDENIVAVINSGSNIGMKLRYKTGNEAGTYAVSVSLKPNQNDGYYVQEHYYLSIFTKVDNGDSNIYHYEIQSKGTTFGDSNYPSADVGSNDPEAPHLFLGNLFTNDITISENNTNRVMSDNNLYLSADLEAKVGFTENAINQSISSYIIGDNVKIYQSFLVALNRLNGESAANQRGILVEPAEIRQSNYTINEVEPDGYKLEYDVQSSYISFTNNYNLKEKLKYAADHPGEGNDHTVTITETVMLSYQASTLPIQFPMSTAEESQNSQTSTTGTYMIGYSNISSTNEGGAVSRASVNTDGTTRLCYYIEKNTSVLFSYNAVSNELVERDGNGDFGQLGLNGKDLDAENESYVQIKTAANYDIYNFTSKTSATYIKIDVRLSMKSDYATALDVSDYWQDFEILDKDGNAILEREDNPSTTDLNERIVVITNSSDNVVTYIVPLMDIQTSSQDVYYIPINFKAYSGANSNFEEKNGTKKNMQYSNYMVFVSVSLLTDCDSVSPITDSEAYDHVVYTNARIHSEVID